MVKDQKQRTSIVFRVSAAIIETINYEQLVLDYTYKDKRTGRSTYKFCKYNKDEFENFLYRAILNSKELNLLIARVDIISKDGQHVLSTEDRLILAEIH